MHTSNILVFNIILYDQHQKYNSIEDTKDKSVLLIQIGIALLVNIYA